MAFTAKIVLLTRKGVRVASKLAENPIMLKNTERMFVQFGHAQGNVKLNIVVYVQNFLVTNFWNGIPKGEA